MSEQRRGRFITFEGGDGSGKSTQVQLLAEHMREAGLDVLVSREPGGTRAGEAIRAILLDPDDDPIAFETEALLMSAARAEHVRKVIGPALARGTWVISDRYVDSTYAYQGAGRGLSMPLLRQVQMLATGGMEPDFTVLLALPAEVGLDRRQRASGSQNRLDAEKQSFHERVRSGYDSLVAAEPHRWFVVSGTQSVEEIATTIWSEFSRRFGAWLDHAPRPHK
jgi:dTMP kinase